MKQSWKHSESDNDEAEERRQSAWDHARLENLSKPTQIPKELHKPNPAPSASQEFTFEEFRKQSVAGVAYVLPKAPAPTLVEPEAAHRVAQSEREARFGVVFLFCKHIL